MLLYSNLNLTVAISAAQNKLYETTVLSQQKELR